MVAVTSLILIAIVGAERAPAMPCFIVSEQKVGCEDSVAFRYEMHPRCLVNQISCHDDMIQLVPFALIFMCTG